MSNHVNTDPNVRSSFELNQSIGSDSPQRNTLMGKQHDNMHPDTVRLSIHSNLSVDSNTRLKRWIFPGMGAIICFFVANSTASIVTNRVNGLECMFYLSSGGIFCCLLQNLIMSCKEYRQGNGFWNPQNIIVDGKLRGMNVLRFCIQVCIFFGIQCFIFMTMYFSHITGVNVGIITTLWSIQPLFSSVLDYFINGQKIQINHILGMLFVIASGVCISLSGKVEAHKIPFHRPEQKELVIEDPSVPKWVAVLFGILTPFWMIANGLFVKHLTEPKVGFNPVNVSFMSSGVGSLIIIIVGVSWYWNYYAVIQWDTFAIGFFSSIFDICGKACIMRAYANGPAGPVSAFVELNNVLLVIFEGIRLFKLPNYLEIIGFVMGIFGALVLSIPNQIKNLILRMFCLYRDPMAKDMAIDADETDQILNDLKKDSPKDKKIGKPNQVE